MFKICTEFTISYIFLPPFSNFNNKKNLYMWLHHHQHSLFSLPIGSSLKIQTTSILAFNIEKEKNSSQTDYKLEISTRRSWRWACRLWFMLPRIRQWLIPHGKDAKDHPDAKDATKTKNGSSNGENEANEHRKEQHNEQKDQAKLLLAANTPKPESGNYHGLVNFGNTCYCNSVIQVRLTFKLERIRIEHEDKIQIQFLTTYDVLLEIV